MLYHKLCEATLFSLASIKAKNQLNASFLSHVMKTATNLRLRWFNLFTIYVLFNSGSSLLFEQIMKALCTRVEIRLGFPLGGAKGIPV